MKSQPLDEMTKETEKIDTSSGRVHKNPIAELMREAAAAVSSEMPVMNWDDITERLHSAADEIERQDRDAERYRWLRNRRDSGIEVIGPEGDEPEQYLYEDALDAAVDAARAVRGNQQ